MKDKLTHTKQDEWSYTTTKPKSRNKVKRLRHKAKRRLINKMIRKELEII